MEAARVTAEGCAALTTRAAPHHLTNGNGRRLFMCVWAG